MGEIGEGLHGQKKRRRSRQCDNAVGSTRAPGAEPRARLPKGSEGACAPLGSAGLDAPEARQPAQPSWRSCEKLAELRKAGYPKLGQSS